MIDRASDILVGFIDMVIKFVLTNESINASIAIFHRTSPTAIFRMHSSNVAFQIRWPCKSQVTVRKGAPIVFDMPPKVFFESSQALVFFRFL